MNKWIGDGRAKSDRCICVWGVNEPYGRWKRDSRSGKNEWSVYSGSGNWDVFSVRNMCGTAIWGVPIRFRKCLISEQVQFIYQVLSYPPDWKRAIASQTLATWDSPCLPFNEGHFDTNIGIRRGTPGRWITTRRSCTTNWSWPTPVPAEAWKTTPMAHSTAPREISSPMEAASPPRPGNGRMTVWHTAFLCPMLRD